MRMSQNTSLPFFLNSWNISSTVIFPWFSFITAALMPAPTPVPTIAITRPMPKPTPSPTVVPIPGAKDPAAVPAADAPIIAAIPPALAPALAPAAVPIIQPFHPGMQDPDDPFKITHQTRSLEVTTQEYGKKWAALSSKKLFKIAAAGIKIAAQFMDTVHSKLNLHPIQIIGQEGIAAGTFLPKMLCLVHGTVTSRNLDLHVRTASILLTDSIVKLLEQVF